MPVTSCCVLLVGLLLALPVLSRVAIYPNHDTLDVEGDLVANLSGVSEYHLA